MIIRMGLLHRTAFTFLIVFLSLSSVFGENRNARSFFQEGQTALSADNPYMAIESFRSALRLNPAYVDARLGMAESLFLLSEYDEASRELEEARPFAGNLRELKLLDARIKTALGRYDEAAGIYRGLLEGRPHDADANRGLGEIYAITGQSELAGEAFSRSLRYSPGDRRVLLQLVLLHDKAREKENAEAVLMEALRLFPDNLAVRIQAAEHYVLYGEWNDAMDQLDRANSMLTGPMDKRYPQVALLNAELSLRKGDPASALVSLKTLPDIITPQALFLLARSYRSLGDEENAQMVLDRLLRNWSEDEIARMYREEYLMRTSNGFKTERGEAAGWHLKKGAAYEEEFYYTRAYNEFRRAKLLNKDNPDVWIAYTDIIRKLGFPEHYLDSLDAALFDIPVTRSEYSILNERRDLLEHSEKAGLAGVWNINDPWDLPKAEWNIGVFVIDGSSSLPMHKGAENTLSLYLADLLDILPDIRIPMDESGRNPEVRTAAGFADAFRQSRDKTDYFIIAGFTETSRTFSATAELFLAGTGERIARFDEMRTGQGMVDDTLHALTASLSSAVPRQMGIVSVDGSRVLLDKGRWQGISSGETWIAVRNGAGRPAKVEGGLVYAPEDYLGTVEIVETSEPLSEGLYRRSGDFDFISPGDNLFLLPEPEMDQSTLNTPDPAFKARLLAIP